MHEINLPSLDDPNALVHANLLFEEQLSGLYLPQWQEGVNGAAKVIVAGGYAGPESEASEGQTVAVGATSAASAAITGTVIDIIYIPDANTDGCFIQIADTPVAVANDDYYLAPNVTYRFPIASGNSVAAIQSVDAGDLYIHPVS